MFYSDWHFCHTLKLMPQEEDAFLEIMFTLEAPGRLLAERNRELENLEGLEDSLLQSYAVPVLIKGILRECTVEREEDDSDYLESTQFVEKSRNLIAAVLEKANQKDLIQDYEKILSDLGVEELDNIVKQIAGIPFEDDGQKYEFSYLESDKCIDSVFLLSILCAAAELHSDSVSATIKERKPRFLDLAAGKRYGVLPWKLAIMVQCFCGMSFDAAKKNYFPEHWGEEAAECMELTALMLAKEQRGLGKPERDVVWALIEESYNLNAFRALGRRIWDEPVWIDETAEGRDRTVICAVLWQNTLWNLALECDSSLCMERLEYLWNAPVYWSGKNSFSKAISREQIFLIPQGSKVEDKEELVPIYICTPWQRRTEKQVNRGEGDMPFHEFKDMIKAPVAFRAFAAAVLLRRMIGGTELFPVEFARILMNLGDAFQSYGVVSALAGRDRAWGRAICFLGRFARKCIQLTGRGEVNAHIPEEMIRLILKGKRHETKNTQLNMLYQSAGEHVCADWALENLRASTISRKGSGANPWLSGGRGSCTAKLLDSLFENGIQPESGDIKNPILLYYQTFREDYRNLIRNREQPLWTVKYSETEEKIRFSDFFLSEELDLAEWKAIGRLDQRRFDSDIWLSVLTLRLEALLGSGKAQEQDYNEWFETWRDELAASVSEQDAYGLLFYLLGELLIVKVPQGGIPSYLPDIFHLVIGTIHNFTSGETAFYLHHLSDNLTYAWEQLGMETGKEVIVDHINALYAGEKDESRRTLLAHFVMRIADCAPTTLRASISQELVKHWEDQCAEENRFSLEAIRPTDWNSLTDISLQMNQGQLSAIRPVQDFSRGFGGRKIRNLFLSPGSVKNMEWYLGIVADDVRYRKGPKVYQINYGSGKIEGCNGPKDCRKGDIVGVQIGRDGTPDKIGHVAWKNDSSPIWAEVLSMTAEKIELRLPNYETVFAPDRIGGKRHDIDKILSYWEPDTSVLLQGKGLCGSAPESGRNVEVKYEPSLDFYVPVKRDFCRMVIEHFLAEDEAGRRIPLVYIGTCSQDGEDEEHRMLFSAGQGTNYVLAEEDWDAESYAVLEEKLEERKEKLGLIVRAFLKEKDGFPILALEEDGPFDEKNWNWADCLPTESPFTAYQDEEGGGWYAPVDVPGMPDRIRIGWSGNSLGSKPREGQLICNVELCSKGWGIRNQRCGEVGAEKLRTYSLRKEWRTFDKVRELLRIKPGDILQLDSDRWRQPLYGYSILATDSHLPVFCAAESITLGATAQNTMAQGLIRNRPCIVEYVQSRTSQKGTEHSAIEIPELSQCLSRLEGIVAEYSDELRAKNGMTENLVLTVWLLAGDDVVSVSVPAPAFDVRPKRLGVPVTAVRQEDGRWYFQVTDRKIQVRALWQLEDRKQQRHGEIPGISLGGSFSIPGHGRCFVTQEEEKPVLYLWDANTIQKGTADKVCGVLLKKGTVSRLNERQSAREVFSYVKRGDIVYLTSDGMEYFGESGLNEFANTDKKTTWSVDAFVYPIEGEKPYYDLRRTFHKRVRIAETAAEKRSKEQFKLNEERYRQWLSDGDYHADGSRLGIDMLQLESLKVPEEIGKETENDQWTQQVLFCEGDRTWFTGANYNKKRVRALLVKQGKKWFASCHEAAPFRVNQELARELRVFSGDVYDKPIYYAGLEEGNCLRFEWGYGLTFLVREEDIVDENGNRIGNTLFYGDKIEYFRMFHDWGEFGWHICIEHEALIRQVEGRIWDDSCGEEEIVQMLQIHRDREKGTVRIEKASVLENTIREGAEFNNGWTFEPVYHAQLEEESIHALLEEEEDTSIIFARLKRGQEKNRTTCLIFSYIPFDDRMENISLLEGKSVCLVAGEIEPLGQKRKGGQTQPSRLLNDYKITYYLQNEKPEETRKPHMRVNVLRRDFSLDESKLRTLCNGDGKRKYYSCNMVVHLKNFRGTNNGVNEWQGRVINTPKRKTDSLVNWVEGQSTPPLVTLDKRNDRLLAEVAPGIICYLPLNVVDREVSSGTIALLKMEEKELKAQIVLQGDREYLPQSGRPVELLVMDGTAKNLAKLRQEAAEPGKFTREELQDAENELRKPHFTIAGLPQLLLHNRGILEKVITQPIPRLAYLSVNQRQEAGQEDMYRIPEGYQFQAARLSLSEDGLPLLHYFYPKEQTADVDWGRITFMDAAIPELTASVESGQWHYHDRTAGYLDEKGKLGALPLPDGKAYQEIILFPDRYGKLRYRNEDFLKYGFPVREITENGLPRQDGEYAVAGVTESSIWIELFPGKLIEIPIDYLFDDGEGKQLSLLWTGMLSPGDWIRLKQDEGFAGNQRHLVWSGVRFGARAGFGDRNNFLPIRGEEDGGVRLGTDLWPIMVPTVRPDAWKGQGIACMTQDNRITIWQQDHLPQPGDTLIANCNGRFLSAPGWNGVRLWPAQLSEWKNVEWLWEDLQGEREKKWLADFKVSLPVKVKNFNRKDGVVHIRVYYEQPDLAQLQSGTMVCCNCIGVRHAAGSGQEIVLRAGGALLSVPVDNVLRGIPAEKVAAVVREMSIRKTSFWMHKEDRGWFAGLRKATEKETVEVSMLYYVKSAAGILCCALGNLALKWLPAERAARVRWVPVETLWKALERRGLRSAKVMEGGSLSLVDAWQNKQKYRAWKTDGTRYRATPMVKLGTDGKGKNRYLVEMYPFGDLISLYSEDEYDCDRNDPIPVEIGEKEPDQVTAYPYGMRRTSLHLTPWVYRALCQASRRNEAGAFEELSTHAFHGQKPECFESYRRMLRSASNSLEQGKLYYELLRNHDRTQEQLVYLYNLSKMPLQGRLEPAEVSRFIHLTLAAWLEKEGRFLASGLNPGQNPQHLEQLDVVPTIAAVLLLHGEEDTCTVLLSKQLSVHLTRMMGIVSGSSIHQEILLRQWLLQEGKKEGLWLRLNRLSLGGEDLKGNLNEGFSGNLSPAQMKRMKSICHSILNRTLPDRDLILTAESLLYSVGQLNECNRFYNEIRGRVDIKTNQLSVIGRILTPNVPHAIAGGCLREGELRNLDTIFRQLLGRDSIPLSFVTDTEIPLADTDCEYYVRLCEKYCSLVRG